MSHICTEPPWLVDEVGRVLLDGSESVGCFYETEVWLPLGGVSHDISCYGVDKFPVLRNNREVLANKSWNRSIVNTSLLAINCQPSSFFLMSSLAGVSSDWRYLRWSWSIFSQSSEVKLSLIFGDLLFTSLKGKMASTHDLTVKIVRRLRVPCNLSKRT